MLSALRELQNKLEAIEIELNLEESLLKEDETKTAYLESKKQKSLRLLSVLKGEVSSLEMKLQDDEPVLQQALKRELHQLQNLLQYLETRSAYYECFLKWIQNELKNRKELILDYTDRLEKAKIENESESQKREKQEIQDLPSLAELCQKVSNIQEEIKRALKLREEAKINVSITLVKTFIIILIYKDP